MKDRKRWKTAAEYAAGIAGLGAAVAVALALPGLYGAWQDGRLIGSVHVSSREEIDFIDAESLNLSGRLKMLGEVEEFVLEEEYDLSAAWTEDERQARAQLCWQKIQEWADCGLLPESIAAFTAGELETVSTYLTTDQGILPVTGFAFYGICQGTDGTGGTEGYAGDGMEILAFLDSETEMLYYVSVSEHAGEEDGGPLRDYLCRCLGYGSYREAGEAFYGGGWPEAPAAPLDPQDSGYDFASPCGAESARVIGYEGMLNLDAELDFETFTGKAYRRVFSDGYSTEVMAVMYGSLFWMELAQNGYIWIDMPYFTATDGMLFGVAGSEKDRQELEFLYHREDPYLRSFAERYGLLLEALYETEVEATSVEGKQE